jgi:hypothetical protein
MKLNNNNNQLLTDNESLQNENVNLRSLINQQPNHINPTEVISNQPNPPIVNNSQFKPKQPSEFSSTDKQQTIVNWLYSIQQYLRLANVSEERKVDVATTFFSSTALDWWRSIERTEGESVRKMSWNEFEMKCIQRFQSIAVSDLAMQRLMTWRQTGNVSSSITGFQQIVQQIPIELLSEPARVFHFLKGLIPDIQNQVRMLQPKSLDESMGMAQRAGTVTYSTGHFNQQQSTSRLRVNSRSTNSQQFQTPQSDSRFAPITIENAEIEKISHSPNESFYSSTGIDLSYLSAEQRQLMKERRCFQCKQVGHIKKDCRAVGRQSTKQ